jgi:hypothetical protein
MYTEKKKNSSNRTPRVQEPDQDLDAQTKGPKVIATPTVILTEPRICTQSESQTWYPLLFCFLRDRGMAFKASFTTREAADIFEVTTWSIRDLVATGQLRSHRLPARKRFLAQDLEDYLAASSGEGR